MRFKNQPLIDSRSWNLEEKTPYLNTRSKLLNTLNCATGKKGQIAELVYVIAVHSKGHHDSSEARNPLGPIL